MLIQRKEIPVGEDKRLPVMTRLAARYLPDFDNLEKDVFG